MSSWNDPSQSGCRAIQITEVKYDSYMKEQGRVPCSLGNKNCCCTYIITEEMPILEEFIESALKKYNWEVKNNNNNDFSDKITKAKILDEKELPEILYEKYKMARITHLRNRNREVKDSDLYLFDQLTPYVKIVWYVFAKLMNDSFIVIDRKSEERDR